MNRNMRLLASASLAVLVLAGAQPAFAQAASVDTVIVTAQKRKQSLQAVPIAVTVLSAQQLADAGVRDLKDLTILTPGLLVASSSNATYSTARIRGVGTVGDNPGLESSVGVLVDGVYRPRNGVALTELGELSRIEVLKGPQGTLFGKNTSAGVINILTAAPTSGFAAGAEFTAGEQGTLGGSAFINGALSDTLSGRLYVSARKRDGYYAIRTGAGPRSERRDDDQDYLGMRAQLMWRPSDRTSVRVIGDYSRREENCCVGVQLNVGPSAAYLKGLVADGGVAQTADPYARTAYSNRGTAAHIRDGGLSAEANIDLGVGKLTSITSWRRWDANLGQDWDFTSADLAYRPDDGRFSNHYNTITQELRLAGTTGRLDWLVGGYYAHERLKRNDSQLYGTDYERYLGLLLSGGADPLRVSTLTGRPVGTSYPVNLGLDDQYRQSEETGAIFASGTFRLTDRLEASLGARYTKEHKSVAAHFANTDAGIGCAAAIPRNATGLSTLCLPWSNPAFNNLTQRQSLSEDAWTGTASLSYRVTDEARAYVSYARGYKAAGFNLDRSQTGLVPDASTLFPAERVDDYEAGVKTEWLERRLIVNLAAFHEKFSHFQLNSFLGTTFAVRSVPEVTAKGADLDFLFRAPLTGLTLQGGLTYAMTQYGPDAVAGLVRLPNTRLNFAPLWSGTLGAAYQRSVAPGLTGRASVEAKYSSSYNTGSDLDPAKVQTGYTVVNGRMSLGAETGRWTVEVWARNLFDQHYMQLAFGAPFQTGTYGAFLAPPRTVGFTLRVRT